MKAIIENCGLDLSLYNITRNKKEFNYRFEARLDMAKTQIFLDLAFFNTLLSVINLATDESDLRSGIHKAFDERGNKNRNPNKIRFTYGFGLLYGRKSTDAMDYMEIHQVGNVERLIYVEL